MPGSHSLQPGLSFANGRFVLARPLGRGGMGEVWLAADERLHEPVALKFLPPEIRGDAAALNDLRRETARSHKLTHANIVRIHDLHEEPDGMAFIVMEYVDGPTLAALRLQQQDRVLPWQTLRPLVEQLCAALEYAHGEKVIHRDLKPANMMVDSRGRLKLADFGIAAVVSDSMSRVSARHSTSGTLPYMSPQQLTGKRPQVSDDIYALGATLYELLTSKPPFYSGDLTHQVLHEPPEPMEERMAALEIQNEIPQDVAAMVMACLAKEPAQRPQSARAVAEWIGLEIERKRSAETLAETILPQAQIAPAEPVSVPAAGGKNRAAIIASAISVLLVIGAAGWYLGKHSSVPATRPEAAPASVSGGTWTNSLGMRFVPVPGTRVLFSIWDTRVQDFAAFVNETGYDATQGMISLRSDGWKARGDTWRNPGFAQGPTHPVCGVSWEDARAFCRWLTEKEQGKGPLNENQTYRLPTDSEWSAAAGSGQYPWGNQWPPPAGAGNYAGSEVADENWTRDFGTIPDYQDGFARTSPVGSFGANRYGLFDMGGNVWQLCEDWYQKVMNSDEARQNLQWLNDDGGGHKYRVLHGASWFSSPPLNLSSECRDKSAPAVRRANIGFRCVLTPPP